MKKLIIPIIGIVVAVGIFVFIPKETHQEPTPIATTEAPTTAIPETTEETTTAPETTVAPTTEAQTVTPKTIQETLTEIQITCISFLDDNITLYTIGELSYEDASFIINSECDAYGIADEIRAEYLAKLDSITPQVKETQAPVVQKPVEQKPTVQEPVVQEPVVQQPQQTGEVYKGESLDKYTSRGYTVEEAKQMIDRIEEAGEKILANGGVMKPEDTQGWGQ